MSCSVNSSQPRASEIDETEAHKQEEENEEELLDALVESAVTAAAREGFLSRLQRTAAEQHLPPQPLDMFDAEPPAPQPPLDSSDCELLVF